MMKGEGENEGAEGEARWVGEGEVADDDVWRCQATERNTLGKVSYMYVYCKLREVVPTELKKT